jgi:hypothetical protein
MGRGIKVADRHTRKPKAGRPPSPEGRVELKASVPPYVKQWLLAKGASPTIKRLVDAEIAKERIGVKVKVSESGDIKVDMAEFLRSK